MARNAFHIGICVLLLLAWPAAPLAAPEPDPSLPEPPTSEQLDAAVARVDRLYAEQFVVALSAERRAAIARRMVHQAQTLQDQPIDALALLVRAEGLFVAADEIESALAAVDAQSELFAIDGLKKKGDLLNELARKAPQAMWPKFLKLLDAAVREAIDAERFDEALRLAYDMRAVAQQTEDEYIIEMASGRISDVRLTTRAYRMAQKAYAKLATAPDDTAAHRVVAEYVGMVRGDWDEALPHVVRSSDATLSKLANADLTAPIIVAERVALGHAWWDVAEKRRAPYQRGLRLRAAHWYTLALPKVEGLERKVLLKRLDALEPAGRKYRVDLDFSSADPTWRYLISDDAGQFEFRDDGAHVPRTPGTYMETRFSFKNGVRYLLEMNLSRAGYTNTGNSRLDAFGQGFAVTRGWGGTAVHIQLERRDDQITVVINHGEPRVRTIDEAHLYEPSTIRYWWRSRSAHIKRVVIEAEQAFAPPDED